MWFKKKKKNNNSAPIEEINFDNKEGAQEKLSSELYLNILAIFLFVFSLVIILSVFNEAGSLGKYLYRAGKFSLGLVYFFSPFAFLILIVKIFKDKKIKIWNWIGLIVIFIALLGMLEFIQPAEIGIKASGGGGYLGFLIRWSLEKIAGPIASIIFLSALLVAALLLIFDTTLQRIFNSSKDEMKKIKGVVGSVKEKIQEKKERKKDEKEIEKEIEKAHTEKKIVTNIAEEEEELVIKKLYKNPPFTLLEDEKGKPDSGNVKERAQIIEKTLKDFDIEVTMDKVSIGPTVTQYTLKPSQGVKLSQIITLHNDIALALAAHPVRIEAPIPGKSLVGIEVPNQKVAIVRLKELIKSKEFKNRKSNLTLALGRNVAGEIILANLDKMPHLLIAGATGSGKSVCLNNIIITLLYQNSQEDLRFILVDPKRVEMTHYDGIPHLLTSPIIEPKKTVNALKWAVKEMERRYKLLSAKGKRDIHSYNEGGFEEHLPFIVICIDELADLMVIAAGDVETAIVRLSQMARAVGIHLIVATQRPSVNVITGLIKANITTRIAFNVASQVDSRTIIDESGAEKLLGNGDMLYRASDQSKTRRIQSPLISDSEVERVSVYLKMHGEADYNEEITQAIFEDISMTGNEEEIDDDLYENAKQTVLAADKASASLLQRRLKIGYARAARLLDYLEERGIVGPQDGSKPREILLKGDEGFGMSSASSEKGIKKSENNFSFENQAREIEQNNERF